MVAGEVVEVWLGMLSEEVVQDGGGEVVEVWLGMLSEEVV